MVEAQPASDKDPAAGVRVDGIRVLHVTPYYEPAIRTGGMAVLTAGLARAQAREGAVVSVFTTTAGLDTDGRNTREEVRDGVRVVYFATGAPSLLFSWELLRACREQIPRCDIVHIHGLWRFPMTWGGRVASHARVPYVISPQGCFNRWAMRYRAWKKWPYWWAIERTTVLQSCRVHFATEDEAVQAQAWIGDHPAAVIPSAIEIPLPVDPAQVRAWRASMGIPVGVPTVGFLGRIHPIKGLDLLVDALADLKEVHLLIAGPDEGETRGELVGRAAARGVAHRVHWTGLLTPAGCALMLRAIDLFVLPSHSESFGLAAAEAMAAGVAVIVTPGVNLARTIVESGAGRVVPRNPRSMGEAIADLLANATTRRAMGLAGCRLVAEQFSPRAVARQMLALYRTCHDEQVRMVRGSGRSVEEREVARSRDAVP